MTATGVPLAFDSAPTAESATAIREYSQIPNLLTIDIQPPEFVVPTLNIARGTLTQITGPDGSAKTYLAQRMALSVATGRDFLGGPTKQAKVLYIDYENPAFMVRSRLEAMGAQPADLENFRVWGVWLPQPPPQISSETLLSIAKQEQPLIVIDPFRFGHSAEENDSGEMSTVMQFLRACAAAGGAVVILHHPARAEGSTGRGSTAIRGAVDLSYLQEMSEETGLITLRCVKNRFGEKLTATIKPNYATGEFTITDSPEFTKKAGEMDTLRRIITETPGLSQAAICGQSGMQKSRTVQLLETGSGRLWEVRKEGQAKHYFLPVPDSENRSEQPEQVGVGSDLFPCSLPYKRTGNSVTTHGQVISGTGPEQVTQKPNGKTSWADGPRCPTCKGTWHSDAALALHIAVCKAAGGL